MFYYLSADIINSCGWIGGNPPKWFDGSDVIDNNKFVFYATFMLPNEDQMLSIFINKEFDELIDNNIYPNCSIKVYKHNVSEESCIKNSHPSISKRWIVNPTLEPREGTPFLFIGATPDLIQDEDYYYTNLEKDGYSFWGQIDEDGYLSDDMICGNSPFAFGALYLYKKENEIIAGFWQFS